MGCGRDLSGLPAGHSSTFGSSCTQLERSRSADVEVIPAGHGTSRTNPRAAPISGFSSSDIQLRLPDYATFQLDAYVFSVSATYTVNGDIFLGKGANRAYPNPLSRGVSISAGWMLNPRGDGHPTRDQLDNFLNSWSAGAGGYAAFGGSVSANGSGKGFNLGVGVGNFGVTPGMINSCQGNVFWRAVSVKRYKVDKWWQLPFLPKPEEGKGPWSVRAIFLILIPFVVLVVFLYTVFHHG
jgi:hypothetical protein